jgi:hypothetical protein
MRTCYKDLSKGQMLLPLALDLTTIRTKEPCIKQKATNRFALVNKKLDCEPETLHNPTAMKTSWALAINVFLLSGSVEELEGEPQTGGHTRSGSGVCVADIAGLSVALLQILVQV